MAIRIKKGLDIPLAGKPSTQLESGPAGGTFAICPDDFPGPVWKAVSKPGDTVSAGDPLMIDKATGTLVLASPVSGTVKEINRGERRHINFISITEGDGAPKNFGKPKNAAEALAILKQSGLWAMMRQRPYDIVPDADSKPRDIFVTAFDTAPLAGEILNGELAGWLDKGLEWLSKLTTGKVYLGVKTGMAISSRHAEIIEFDGPHPAGNVGTQIAAIKPVNKGETVWTLDALTAARIGKLLETGTPDYSAVVALTGPDVKNPHLVGTLFGASIESLLANQLDTEKGIRIISGNVLTGVQVEKSGYLHFPYRQVTVISEGDDADEFMGWASLNPGKFSVKRSFPAFLKGLSKPFHFDARIKGGHRAMILSGEYDKVFPFDIYPEYLIKAILANDIERMEKLGIYEVAPEDFALPEFVDTSKIELQKIVRQGLDNLRKELS